MPDVCSEVKTIVLSPELKQLIDSHNNKAWLIHWIHGLFYFEAKDKIIAEIVKKYDAYFAMYYPAAKGARKTQFERMHEKVIRMVKEFKALSHTDIDILIKIKETEFVKFPITHIDGQLIIDKEV